MGLVLRQLDCIGIRHFGALFAQAARRTVEIGLLLYQWELPGGRS